MTRIDFLRKIVAEKQAQKINVVVAGKSHKVWVDLTTASLMVRIYDALSEGNKAKYIALEWPRFVSVTWKLAA